MHSDTLRNCSIGMLLVFCMGVIYTATSRSADHAAWKQPLGEQIYLEECYGVTATQDKGYILAGRRSLDTAGAKSNVFFLKTDAAGQILWPKEVDPYPDFKSHSRALSVVEAEDGSIFAAGWVETENHGDEGYLVKLDATGAVQRQWIYGNAQTGSGADDDAFASIARTSDGGFILAGATEAAAQRGLTDAWLVKVDAGGKVLWQRVYGGEGLEYAQQAIQTADSGYIFVGNTDSFGLETRVMVQKVTAQGDQEWLQVIDLNDDSDSGDQDGRSVLQNPDGSYLVAGFYELGADPGIPFLVKLDADGNEMWRKVYNVGDGSDRFDALAGVDSDAFLAVGRTNSLGAGSYDVLIAKIDAAGAVIWRDVYGGNDYDAGYAVHRTEDGGSIACGKAVGMQWPGGADMYLIRFAPEGGSLPGSRVYLPMVIK